MLFFLDCETSGLDPDRHGILQVAWIIDVNKEIKAEHSYDVQLRDDHDICLAALDCNDFTLERMRQGKPLGYVMAAIRGTLLDAGGMTEQAVPCGHNVQFDISFLRKAEEVTGEKVTMYLQWWRPLCTLSCARWLSHTGRLHITEHKLEKLCEHLSIELNAHDALSDVRAVREIYYRFKYLLDIDS